MKLFLSLLVVILLALLGVGSWLYYEKNNELQQARMTIAGLNTNITSLQAELGSGLAEISSLQVQIDNEKAHTTALESDLDSSIAQLNISSEQRASLQSELEVSKAKIVSLESELASAEAKITGSQDGLVAEINRLNADLAAAANALAGANTSIAQLNEEKSALESLFDGVIAPRHFYSLEELQAWLAFDDTDTNPDYFSLGPAEKCFILQVRALRDGLLLPA